ncbi:MAG: CHAT domain-containing protein [Nostoc sp. SerVER01]|nr:CHAT domain-containing tetratricopeptide repeat protein [Nostoc sp. SerVER01]
MRYGNGQDYSPASSMWQVISSLFSIGKNIASSSQRSNQEIIDSYEQIQEILRQIEQSSSGRFLPQLFVSYYEWMMNRPGGADFFNQVGIAYSLLGRYQQAIELYENARQIFQKSNNQLREAETLNNLGNIYSFLGRYGTAKKSYEQALNICSGSNPDEKYCKAHSLNGMGIAYLCLGQLESVIEKGKEYYQQAKRYLNQARNIFIELGKDYDQAIAVSELGLVDCFLGQIEKGIEKINESLNIQHQQGNRIPGVKATSLNYLGVAYIFLEQYQDAINSLQQSLTILRAIQSPAGEAFALGLLGLAFFKNGNFVDAEEALLNSINMREQLRSNLKNLNIGKQKDLPSMLISLDLNKVSFFDVQIDTYGVLQQVLIAQEKRETALEISERGRTREFVELLAKKQPTYPIDNSSSTMSALSEADKLLNQGIQQYKRSLFREALQSWEQALKIYREIENNEGEANCLNNLGGAYFSLGEYQQAIEYHQQSLAIKREIGDRQGKANCLNNLGGAYFSLGEYQQAIDYYQQSLTIKREIGDRQGKANCLNNLGGAYFSLGEYQQAIDYYQQSLTIKQEIGDRQGEASSLANLGTAYLSLGKYQQAIDYYQQSLAIKREIGDRQGEASSLGNLGIVYQSVGKYQQAIDYYQQYLRIAREIGDRQGEANSLGNLGLAYQLLEQYQQAIDYHHQSLVIKRKIGYRQGEAESLGGLGNAYFLLGQYQQAIDYYQQYLAVSQEIGARLGEAKSLGNLGIVYQLLGQYEQAIEYHQQSLTIKQEIGDRQGEADSLNNLGDTLLKTNQFTEAETKLRAAIQIYESIREDLGDSDTNKVSIFETQARTYRLLQEVLVALNKIEDALVIAEKGRARAFVELLTRRLTTNFKGISQVNSLPQTIPTPSLEEIQQIAQEETEEISQANSLQQIVPAPTFEEIQQIAQDKKATIVEYSIIYDDFREYKLYIWVIKPIGKIEFCSVDITFLSQQQNTNLDDLVFNARYSIGVEKKPKGELEKAELLPNKEGRYPLLQLLHKILIQPIVHHLPEDDRQLVIFIPQQSLFLVPFPALQDNDGKYLIEKHTILTAPSIEILNSTRQRQKQIRGLKKDILVVGDPTIHTKFLQNPYRLEPLPDARQAAEVIAKLLKTQAIIGEQATKAFITQQMESMQLIHISSHALLYEIEELDIPGAIILASSENDEKCDGALKAWEVLNLKLNAELVVLSACSTGQGNITGDGVIGLSRSFMIAGVPSIIVSLWKVSAPPAKLLMTEFYQNLQRNMDKAAALREAMLKIKAEKTSRIKYWAAFTLIGETETISLQTNYAVTN